MAITLANIVWMSSVIGIMVIFIGTALVGFNKTGDIDADDL